jgi:type IV pilus assembly protein PilW
MKSLKLQRGMSLVELLVALAIGAFLIIGAVTVQSQTRKTFSVNEQQARLQETARFVLSVIEPDVQLAGLYGFSNIPDGVRMSVDGNIQYASDMRTNKAAIEGMPAVLDKCGANYVVDVTAAIQADDGSWPMAEGCDAAGGGHIEGTDILTVRRSSVDKVAATKGRIQLYTNRLAREDQVLFMDGVAPGPLKDDEKEIRDLIMQAYYVAQDSEGRPNLPSLRLKRISNDAGEAGAWDDQEVVRGVEDIQIELGVDPGEDRNADLVPDDIAGDGMADFVNGVVARYVKPGDAILSSGQVVAVRIWVRVRAEEPEAGFEDNRVYNYGSVVDFRPGDGYRRVVMSRTIFLRNSRAFPSSS